MPDQQPLSAPAAFFATLWGKILAVLAAITMVVGIYVEIVAAWRGTNDAFISSINVQRSKAEACSARVKFNAEAAPLHAGDAYALEWNRHNAEFVKDCVGEQAKQAYESDRAKESRPSKCKENEKYVFGACRPVEEPN